MPAVLRAVRISPEKILFPTLERGDLTDDISDMICPPGRVHDPEVRV